MSTTVSEVADNRACWKVCYGNGKYGWTTSWSVHDSIMYNKGGNLRHFEIVETVQVGSMKLLLQPGSTQDGGWDSEREVTLGLRRAFDDQTKGLLCRITYAIASADGKTAVEKMGYSAYWPVVSPLEKFAVKELKWRIDMVERLDLFNGMSEEQELEVDGGWREDKTTKDLMDAYEKVAKLETEWENLKKRMGAWSVSSGGLVE
ncbi:hypothetical protein P280DRAFT_479238 [Massarina eburnea CBS 473.64]|uniref:Uncharacterized protein n=1 Tax=Massarina eburnea CBS 473.64 TaxID=1395130 RepID=A0A6A6S356_9PLEO|nr:hypothetical protein P280DRAFT_479238 [Massarina eburnea CBS 473.64]